MEEEKELEREALRSASVRYKKEKELQVGGGLPGEGGGRGLGGDCRLPSVLALGSKTLCILLHVDG
jgi:hypothetical protein